MNFFRGLLDLINSLQRLSGDSTNPTGEKGEQTLPTLKDILNAIRGVEKSPPKRDRPPLPEMPKMLPFPEPQSKPEQSQPERPEPPKPKPQNKPKESAGSFSIADMIADFKKNPPKGVGEDLTPFWEDQIKSIGGEPAPPGASAKPPEGSPADFTPPTINVQPPGVTVNTPGQSQPQQPQGQDTGRLAALLSSFVDGLRGLVDKVAGVNPSQQQTPPPPPTSNRPPLPQNIQPPKPATSGVTGNNFVPGQSKAKQGVFSKLSSVFGKSGSGAKVGAAGQAGGGGMFSKLASSSAVAGAAVSAVAGGMVAATFKLLDFSMGLNDANEELKNYSGQLSMAFAQLQIQELQQKMSMAQATQGSGSALAGDIQDLRDATQPMKETFTTLKNAFAGGVVQYFKKIADIADWGATIMGIHDAAQKIEENTSEREQSTIAQQAMHDLASGEWRSESQNGLFQPLPDQVNPGLRPRL